MDKTTQGIMFSSKSNDWATPQDFYNKGRASKIIFAGKFIKRT